MCLSAWGRSARPQVEALHCHAGQSLTCRNSMPGHCRYVRRPTHVYSSTPSQFVPRKTVHNPLQANTQDVHTFHWCMSHRDQVE
jgi:hypothetical protein